MTPDIFLKQVPEHLANEDFYHLCKAFLDLALNTEKFKAPDGRIAGKFSKNDIDVVVRLVNSYLSKYSVEADELKRSIKLYSHYTIDANDKRQKAYFERNSKDGSFCSCQSGVFYSFIELPDGIMDAIFEPSFQKNNQ